MSSQQTTDSSLPTDQQQQASGETVSKADFDKLSGNYHAAQRQIEKLKGSQVNPDSLIQDTDFVKRVFEAHSVPFNDEGKFVIPEAYKDEAARETEYQNRLKKERATWEAKDYNPLKAQLEETGTRLNSTLGQNLELRLEMNARDAGVVDGKFKSTSPFGSRRKAVHGAAESFKYSQEAGDHILHDGDKPVYTSTGDPVTPDNFWEYFKSTASDEHKLDWFGNPAQRGSGFQNNGRPGGEFVLTREQARDSTLYRQMRAQAAKAGKEVKILD